MPVHGVTQSGEIGIEGVLVRCHTYLLGSRVGWKLRQRISRRESMSVGWSEKEREKVNPQTLQRILLLDHLLLYSCLLVYRIFFSFMFPGHFSTTVALEVYD